MATFAQQITSDANDGYSDASVGTWNPTATFLRLGQFSTHTYYAGFRFTGITIPHSAVITAATLTLTMFTGYSGTFVASFYGDAVDNAAAWSATSRPDQITRTSASVAAQSGASGAVLVHNVAAIIQEIVSRAGWASGNAIRIGSAFTTTTGGDCEYYDFTGDPTKAATLSITYSVPSNFTQSIAASTTLTASLRKSAGRTLAVSLSSVASLRRAIGKPILATFTGTPSLSAGKRALAAISASFTGTVTMTRAVGHLVTQTVSASFSTAASLTARLNARVTIAAQVVPQVSISAGKAFRRTITVAAPFSAFVGRIYAVTISAAFSGIASLFHASQSAPPPDRLIQLGSANRIIDLPASADRIIEL